MMILGEDDYVTTLGRKKGHFEFEDYEAGDKKEGMFWIKGVLGGKVLVSFGKTMSGILLSLLIRLVQHTEKRPFGLFSVALQ
jgi:hypothetical protein